MQQVDRKSGVSAYKSLFKSLFTKQNCQKEPKLELFHEGTLHFLSKRNPILGPDDENDILNQT